LGIADWGFDGWEAKSVVWTVRQTKPILAEEASALMMDYGLLMIWNRQPPAPQSRRSCGRRVKQSQFSAFLG
jgi:hypothetical protein